MSKTILFVDDEKQILKSLYRLFMALDYEILLAESGEEALEILSENKVNLLVTDMRMPNMSGLDLLLKVKSLYPEIIRVVLSGYSDEILTIRSLNENLACTYIFKPWDNDKLIAQIFNIFEFEKHLNKKNLLTLINQMESLKTLPHIYKKITECIENNSDIDVITSVIEEDLTVSAKVLQIINSAFYGVKTASIKAAISFMGLNTLKSIVLASTIITTSGAQRHDYEMIWQHANLTNKLITPLYEGLLSKKLPDNFLAAGLLHDIGRAILITNLQEEYEEIEKMLKEDEKITCVVAEKKILKVTHQEIGGYFLYWWGLPLPVAEAALFHQEPLSELIINREIVAFVHIASYHAWKILKQDKKLIFNPKVYELLGVSESDCMEIIDNFITSNG